MPQQTSQTSSEIIDADRLIIATNRGPVEYYQSRDKILKSRRGAGGVVTALLGAMPSMPATWVALAMTEGDRQAIKEARDGLLPSPVAGQKLQLRYVTIPKIAYRKHYDLMSNQVLWFLQHYLLNYNAGSPSAEQIYDAWENGYRKANEAIAEAVSAEIARDTGRAVVMLHDYHLYLAPAMIRERRPHIVMQQFIHIPWPEVRYWESTLPTSVSQAIFAGLLGNDIIGFQTARDARNFIEGVGTLLDDIEVDVENSSIFRRNHRTLVQNYPISISVSEERRVVQSRAGKQAARRIQPLLGEQTIMRVDRIEPTKNIALGFRAYERLLQEHAELHGKVTFLAFLVPSREGVTLYRRYKDEILKLVEDINHEYGQNGWQPIHTFVGNDRTQALAAMQYYDVLLVNPLIDGMNLVAKEGPIVNAKDGVLVLSRTSGAFQQLEQAALPIAPADMVETAQALYFALTIAPPERHQKALFARQEVERNDLKMWITQQTHDINQLLKRSRSS